MKVTIPLRTVSALNAREHWAARAKRSKVERQCVALAFPKLARGALGDGKWAGCVVTLIRHGPRKLDDDNLQGALKAVRDEVAKQLGLSNDADPRIAWLYEQAAGEYAVTVRCERVVR